MDFTEFLTPVSYSLQEKWGNSNEFSLGGFVQFDPEKITHNSVVLLTINEYRQMQTNINPPIDPDFVSFREQLYQFNKSNWKKTLIDLGTLHAGNTFEDSCFALNEILKYLNETGAKVLMIGGSQALFLTVFKAQLKTLLNVGTVDYQPDLNPFDSELSDQNVILKILYEMDGNKLLKYSNIGSQSPYWAKEMGDVLDQLNFENIRLGKLSQQQIHEAEPFLRNLDILSVDMNAVQVESFHSGTRSLPNGFNAREICGLMRYAGFSQSLNNIMMSHYVPNEHSVSDALMAEMVWYYLEAINNIQSDGEQETYRVQLDEAEIVFYRSQLSEKWWMEVEAEGKKERIPCTNADYLTAISGEIPERWWRFYKKYY